LTEEITIGDVGVRIIIDEGVKYYPISYLSREVLLRRDNDILNNKIQRDIYKDYIKYFNVYYNDKIPYKTKYISEDGLKLVLSNSKASRLNSERRKALNVLLSYLDLPNVSEKEILINDISKEEMLLHNEYYRDIINEFISVNEGVKYQLCIKCCKYYPLHTDFFHFQNDKKTYEKICHDCKDDDKRNIINNNLYFVKYLYKIHREEGYLWYKNRNIVKLYEIFKSDKEIREILKKEDYLEIIKYLYDNGVINKDNLTMTYLRNNCGLIYILRSDLTLHGIYSYLFGEDYYLFPWKYDKFRFNKDIKFDYKFVNDIFNNYVIENNIIINKIFDYNYRDILKKCCLPKIIDNDLLLYVVSAYDYKYPGYKFKIYSENYYKRIENRILDLKYLIEKEMKLQIEKIPLYITNTYLQRSCNKLYGVLRKYYDYNLFNWINECYPGKFIESDFNISVIRNEFDSQEEAMVHDLLKKEFSNVVYNSKSCNRGNDRTVNFDGIMPDWFVFTRNGVYVIEYFGLYVKNKNSKRIKDYVERTDKKIKEYKKFNGYKFIYLYPEDIRKNMIGFYEKVKIIKQDN